MKTKMEQKTLTEKRFFEWHEDDVSVTLRNKGGSYGGGQQSACHLLYQDTIGALCATDYKWVQQEQVMQGKLIVEGFIADHPTPKIHVGDGTAYTTNSRDYKGVMIVVLSENDRSDNGK